MADVGPAPDESPAAPAETTTPPAAAPTPPPDPAPAADDEPDPAAVAEALTRATLTVHTAQKHGGPWPGELEVERGPKVFLLAIDLELASFAYRIDPDRFLLETTSGDIVSQSPVTRDQHDGRMTALFVVGNALRAKSVVLSYEGKRSKPFKLPRR